MRVRWQWLPQNSLFCNPTCYHNCELRYPNRQKWHGAANAAAIDKGLMQYHRSGEDDANSTTDLRARVEPFEELKS